MPSLHKVNTLFSHPLPLRFILCLLLLVFLLMAWGTLGHFWVQGEFQELKDFLDRYTVQWGNGMLLAGSLVYLLLLSLPFVPGVELGLLLMCVFGREGVLPVYFATVGGLMLAFTVGRRLPRQRITAWVERLGIALPAPNPDAGIGGFLEQSPLGPWLQRHSRIGRYLVRCSPVALAVLLNLPGNYLLGGGGGIALFCGLTRQFRWPGFLLTIMLAVAPMPLLVWFGFIQLERGFNS